MFSTQEIKNVLFQKEFVADFSWVQETLVRRKAKQAILFDKEAISRLDYFVDAIISSCVDWSNDSAYQCCKIAGEISEALSYNSELSFQLQRVYRLKAALLYECAGLPALSQSAIQEGDFDSFVYDFFRRSNSFRHLAMSTHVDFSIASDRSFRFDDVIEAVFNQDAYNLMQFLHGLEDNSKLSCDDAVKLAKIFNCALDSSVLNLFSTVLRQRRNRATIANVSFDIFDILKKISFPTELWPAQIQALEGGMLDESVDSFGLASPTGTGKTFLTRLLIVNAINENANAKVLYIVPSRALVYEVAISLYKALEDIGVSVVAVNPQLVVLEDEEENEFEQADVVVLTPEKADLLIRLGQSTISTLSHVIIDEAHHIESDTRGVLLELYLWRLKKMMSGNVRFVFLSAVAPNIKDLTEWLGNNPKSEIVLNRATRMRAGVYRIRKNEISKQKEGWIDYSDGVKLKIVSEKIEVTNRRMIAQLASSVFESGPVLVVAKGKKECENLAKEMIAHLDKNRKVRPLNDAELRSATYNRLDSRLEREMYAEVPMREYVKNRVAYHHAGLPPRVRTALEDAIREGLVDFVFATTTLAEGVNFPFSTVIVQALVLREPPQPGVPVRYRLITPRTFWNIAGRAGRPGFDREGQVILFEPTLGLEKVNAVISDYLNPNLKDIPRVESALSKSIVELKKNLETGDIKNAELDSIELSDNIPGKIRGTINLLRVGLVHAKAANILGSTDEILDNSFAKQTLTEEELDFGKAILRNQETVINQFFSGRLASYEKIVAEMGLSIDTIERLKNYVISLENWQIQSIDNLFFGGELNLQNVSYVVGPVANLIAELEGYRLGGFVTEIIEKWLSGIPLVKIKTELKYSMRDGRLEDLITIIYSRIQFLLPWGLFATDSILAEEAKVRGLGYSNTLRKLSYLTDSGVPSFDAHRLVSLDFERVDATRIYREYKARGGLKMGVDIVGWINSLTQEFLRTIVQGIDNRRIDYDLDGLLNNLMSRLNERDLNNDNPIKG